MQRLAVLALVVFSWSAPLGAAEKTVEELIRQLGSSNFEEREQAAKELVAIGPKALEPLRKALDNTDKEIARRAKDCIPIIERNSKIAASIQDLKDQRPEVRRKAAGVIGGFGRNAAEAVPALIEAMDDPDPKIRNSVFAALTSIGTAAKPAVPKMIRFLRDGKRAQNERILVAIYLERLGPDAAEAVPTALEILERGTIDLKLSAASLLGSIRPKDKVVVQALLAAMKNENMNLQGCAAASLGAIRQEASLCVPALMELLKKHRGRKESDDPRRPALLALGCFGKEAKPAIPLVLEFLREQPDPDSNYKFIEGFRMFQLMGPHAREAIPELKKYVQERRNSPDLLKELNKVLLAIGDGNP